MGTMGAVPAGDTELSLSRLRSHACTWQLRDNCEQQPDTDCKVEGRGRWRVGVPCTQPAPGVTYRVNDPIAIDGATKRAMLL